MRVDPEPLIAALAAALAVAPPVEKPSYVLDMEVSKVDAAGDDPGHPYAMLITTLRSVEDLRIFDGIAQAVPNAVSRWDYHRLAIWLIRRSQRVGPAAAVAGLQHYLDLEEIPCHAVWALEGLPLERPCALGNGYELVPWDLLPASEEKDAARQMLVPALRFPTAALTVPYGVVKLHGTVEEVRDHNWQAIPRQEPEDAILCAGLFGPTAPHTVAWWVQVAPWAPMLGGLMGHSPHTGKRCTEPWPEEAYSAWPKLVERFRALPPNRRKSGTSQKSIRISQKSIRISMQRLNAAIRRTSPVDAAIDLGIALEGLFLSDQGRDRGELSYRLRVRASRFLGATRDDRQAVFQLTGRLYTARSRAAHAGELPATSEGESIESLLSRGFELVARSIRKLLETDPTGWDWDDVTLA